MSKVKNILFRLKLEGKGIVNNDSIEQKWVFNNLETNNFDHLKTKHNNVSYAKKRFFGSGDNAYYKIVISPNCLRHNIFIKEAPNLTPNLVHNKVILYSFIASPTSLIRGYLESTNDDIVKRSSALTISEAIQTNDSISYLETFSKSGGKNTDADKEGSGNTYFKKEVIGDMTYESMGFIDLMKLQFVSCDQIFDRYAFNPDLFPFYKQLMSSKIPNFDSELGYYQQIGSEIKIPEYGYVLSNENVLFLVKYLFKKILELNIKNSGSYVNINHLEYKLVFDPIEDTMYSEDNWNVIKNMSDIEAIDFEVESFYQLEDKEESEKIRQSMIDNYEAIKKAKKDKKTEAAKNKSKDKKQCQIII